MFEESGPAVPALWQVLNVRSAVSCQRAFGAGLDSANILLVLNLGPLVGKEIGPRDRVTVHPRAFGEDLARLC
jgi:hypothetical protein